MIPYVIEKGQGGNEKMYDIWSRLLKDRIIFIRGEFNDDMADSVVAQLLFLESVDPKSDIYMYINSPGGSMTSMYAIYDVMRYIKNEIVTVGFGQCASAASFVLAAGTRGKRFALPNTELMIHEFSGGSSGKAHELRNKAKHLERCYENMIKHYAMFTGQTVETLQKDMEKDYYMTSTEAKEYGLIDEVHMVRI